jgi:hypothetical protein
MGLFAALSTNDTQHVNSMLYVIRLSVAFFYCFAACHYPEFGYAEFRYVECHYAECCDAI